jgi:hypothetical protein
MTSSLKASIKRFYRYCPLLRELNMIRDSVAQQSRTLGAMSAQLAGIEKASKAIQCASVIQAIELLKSGNERYRDAKRLLCYGAQYWSQNYEDGALEEIFRRIGTTTKTFVEIGIGDGTETNTTALLSDGWTGFWFETDAPSCAKIRNRLAQVPDVASRIKLIETFVAPSTIARVFEEVGVPDEVDLFSLDIDFNTYHVWKALGKFRPRVVVVEYNAGISPSRDWINGLNEGEKWDGSQNFGASLKAFELLGRSFSYSLVGCDITGANAFFVRSDLIQEGMFAEPFTAENHYEPPRYRLLYRNAHPSAIF